MSAKNGEGTIVTCAATHLDGQYTCQNTAEYKEVEVNVSFPETAERKTHTIVLRLRQLPCGCLVWGGMAFSAAYRPIGDQICDLMIAKKAHENAIATSRAAIRRSNGNGGRH